MFLAFLAAVAAQPAPMATPQPARPLVIAHRGLSAGYPENTLAAYRNAIALGVDAIEIDLRATADGKVVVLHDATVDRTTNGQGKLADLTLAQVKALDAGKRTDLRFAGERIPTYEEVLALVRGTNTRLLLDIKQGKTLNIPEIVRITLAADAADRVIFGVRSLGDLHAVKTADPRLRTLGFIPSSAAASAFADEGADIIRLWSYWVTAKPGLIATLQARGKPVWIMMDEGIGPDPATHRTIAAARPDGILTDYPELLMAR